MAMKPIETRYQGCRFRSRLEARWAVFFDALKIEWQYEAEGFVLEDGTRYLPDFFLPKFDQGLWVEVKPTNENFEKAYEFARSGGRILLADGTPMCKQYTVLDGAEVEANNCFYDKYISGTHREEHRMFWSCGSDEEQARWNPDVARAVEAARSARFER
jgi:hypothetical protein